MQKTPISLYAAEREGGGYGREIGKRGRKLKEGRDKREGEKPQIET